METDRSNTVTHLFTLRVWLEVLDEGHSEWRGEVKYTPTGEIYYFRRWDQLHATLQRCLPGFELEPGSGMDDSHLIESGQKLLALDIEENSGTE